MTNTQRRSESPLSPAQNESSLASVLEAEFQQSVDGVLDYLQGAGTGSLLIAAVKASPDERSVRFVQIGSINGAEI